MSELLHPALQEPAKIQEVYFAGMEYQVLFDDGDDFPLSEVIAEYEVRARAEMQDDIMAAIEGAGFVYSSDNDNNKDSVITLNHGAEEMKSACLEAARGVKI